MTLDGLRTLLTIHPKIRQLIARGSVTLEQVNEAAMEYAQLAIKKAASRNTYHFLLGEFSTTTTVNISDYVIDDNSAADVIWLSFGDGNNLLREVDELDGRRLVSGRRDMIPTFAWYKIAPDGQKPKIRLIGTPNSTGRQILVGFRRKDITVSEWPELFGYVLVTELLALMFPEFLPLAEADAARMASDYDKGPPPRGNAQLDSEMTNNNIRRNRHHGFGGRSDIVVIETNT